VSLVAPDEAVLLRDIERVMKRAIPFSPLPEFKMVELPASANRVERFQDPRAQSRDGRGGARSGGARSGGNSQSAPRRSAGGGGGGQGGRRTGGGGRSFGGPSRGDSRGPRRDADGNRGEAPGGFQRVT
jgi:ATP-dependent RNA helicase RhlE